MGIPIEGATLDVGRYEQMDKMVESLSLKATSTKKEKVKLEDGERYKSYQYEAPNLDKSSTHSPQIKKRPNLRPPEVKNEVKEESVEMAGMFAQVVQRSEELDSLGEKKVDKKELETGEIVESLQRKNDWQRENGRALLKRGEREIEEVNSQIFEREASVKVEENFQLLSTVLKVEENKEEIKGVSLEKLGWAIAFLAGIIERLDLVFRLYEANSPLNDWLKDWGFPEKIKKPIRNIMVGVLLGENDSGFAKSQFQAFVRGEEVDSILNDLDKFSMERISFERFVGTIESSAREILEYLLEEMEETRKMIELLKFIVALLMLMLLLVMEKLFSMKESGDVKEIESQGMSKSLQKSPEGGEGDSAVQVAYQVVARVFEQVREESSMEERKKKEEIKEDMLDDAMVEALKNMMRDMFSDEKKMNEDFLQLFENATESINKIFESKEQAITLAVKNSA